MSEKNETGSVTRWLEMLSGDPSQQNSAQQDLWERYFSRLKALARSRMAPATRRARDEEDIALSALNSFFRRSSNAEFPHLNDRSGLWPLLARITLFKAIKHVEHERAQKRFGDSNTHNDDGLPSLEDVICKEPTPEFVAEMQEQVEMMLVSLENLLLREIAELKLSGYRNTEIAQLKDLGLRSVERKLARIRTLWSAENIDRVAE